MNMILHNIMGQGQAWLSAWVWSLVHSVWIGLVLAFLYYLFLKNFSHIAARWQYTVGILLLAILPISVLGIFIYLLPETTTAATTPSTNSINPILYLQSTVLPSGWTLKDKINFYSLPVFNSWVIGVFFLSVRMLVSYFKLSNLKIQSAPIDRPLMLSIFQTIKDKAGLKQSIALVSNKHIDTPSTFGYLKPVIILPISIINHLTPEETYAILAHEMAHIIRKDYLQNLILSTAEILFFFHPSIWWFTHILRTLREQCCDAIAIELGAERMALTKALVYLEENHDSPLLAMAFSHKHQLLNRIQRLFYPTMKTEFSIQRSQAALLLGFSALLFIMARPIAHTDKDNPMLLLSSFLWEPKSTADTSKPKSKIEKISKDNGKEKIELQLKDKKIEELKINDKIIPKAEYEKYADKTEALTNELKEMEYPTRKLSKTFRDFDSDLPVGDKWLDGSDFMYEYDTDRKKNRSGSNVYRFRSPIIIDGKKPGVYSFGNGAAGIRKLYGQNDKIRYIIEGDSTGIEIIDDQVIIKGKNGDVIVDIDGHTLGATSPGFPFSDMHLWGGGSGFNFKSLEGLKKLEGLKSLEGLEKLEKLREWEGLGELEELKKWNQGQMNHLHEWQSHQKAEMDHWIEKLKSDKDKFLEEWEEKKVPTIKSPRAYSFGGHEDDFVFTTKRDKLSQAIQRKLLKDEFIKQGETYDLKIDKNGIKINGKKQKEDVFKEYKELIEKSTGFEIKGDTQFTFNGITDKK